MSFANAVIGAVQATSPLMTFLNFGSLNVPTNEFFQYRAIMESDDTGTSCNYGSGATWCSPELQTVSIAPTHYDNTGDTIYSLTGFSYVTLTGFSETGVSCGSGTLYNVSKNGSTWYWWNGSAWAAAGGTTATTNAASVINTNISTFPSQIGTGSCTSNHSCNRPGSPLVPLHR